MECPTVVSGSATGPRGFIGIFCWDEGLESSAPACYLYTEAPSVYQQKVRDVIEDRRKPRSDGLRNRKRLIDSAKEILGQGGPGASLEAVARRAEVGIGTLYRHFPTREALFQAVYRHEVDQLIKMADGLKDAPDAGKALRAWLHAGVALVATKRGLLGALAVVKTEASTSMYSELSARMRQAVDQLLQRAILQGQLQADVSADDLLETMYAFCYARQPEPGWEAQVLRLLDIFLNGLKLQ